MWVVFVLEEYVTQKAKFRKPNSKELRRLEQSMKAFHEAAGYFQEHFVGRKMVYSTSNDEIAVYFSGSNYMHLCGLSYSKGAEKFFIDCLDNKVDLKSLKVKDDGTTMQKLQVLPFISELTSSYLKLTGSGRYLFLEFDYALRTRKQILAVTLKATSHKTVPQSLLDLKSQQSFPIGEAVRQIYSVHLSTKEVKEYFNSNQEDSDL